MIVALSAALLLVAVVVVACFVYTGRRERAWIAERSDMLDRLMSRNIAEYKEHQPQTPVPKSDPVNLTEEEEWAREVAMMRSGAG